MADSAAARHHVTFPGDGGRAHGYLALPPSGQGPGLLIIQEWWGPTSRVADLIERFAAEGFVALAPALHDEDGAPDPGGAATDPAGQVRDLHAAVDFLLDQPELQGDAVAVAGFCAGAGLALELAAREGDRVAAVVPFYGLPADPDYDYRGLTAHVLGHFGEHDDQLATAAVDEAAIRIGEATDLRPEFHFYPAGHGFMNDENPHGDYDALQARIAWRRTLSFLRGHLG
ncbi:carboxymethylenebutenolidase [Kitasatospora sp. MAP12-15]|uniref:dienelactone hydrolase family protein n=1 Tax=unclassified Kitasatospora TaxID=2633591 RepID=UPI0024772340|nr:dienelactone hydrolase family protein [Kitasatospora sp. MAP12-44]MDH6108997.1 carboxymethylenebutenolidase [Kitasatospora sp. MAP12-44]